MTQSIPAQEDGSAGGRGETKVNLSDNVTWLSDYKFYKASGIGVELSGGGGDGSILKGNLSDLFSGDHRSFEWNLSHNYVSTDILFYFESVQKITRLRIYPLGDISDRSKLCNFSISMSSVIGTKYTCGTWNSPISTSSIQTPDQYFEFNLSDVTSDYIRVSIFPYYKSQPCCTYYWNEIEIYYDPSYSPYPNNITVQNTTIQEITQNITNVTVQNITQEFQNNTYNNLSYNDSALWANLSLLFRNYSELLSSLNELNETILSNNNTNTLYLDGKLIRLMEELNDTLENITALKGRVANEENSTILAAYNDTGMQRRLSVVENRTSTNTIIYNNRTTTIEKNDVGFLVLGGLFAGAGGAAGGAMLTWYSLRKKK